MFLGGNTVYKNQAIPWAVSLLASGTEGQGQGPELAAQDPEGPGEGRAAQRGGERAASRSLGHQGVPRIGTWREGGTGQLPLSLEFSGVSPELSLPGREIQSVGFRVRTGGKVLSPLSPVPGASAEPH